MDNLNTKRKSKFETLWIVLFQFIGLIMFIAPIFLPILAWFSASVDSVPITFFGGAICVSGFFIARGGAAVGTVTNNIGIVIIDFLRKLTNTTK